MVAEREALAPLEARKPAPKPPMDPLTVAPNAGIANPDELRLRELARYEAAQKRQSDPAHLPDPMDLARRFLRRTGYPEELIERVQPILSAAGGNGDLERQMSNAGKSSPFAPPGN
jgi:hypothetical protein